MKNLKSLILTSSLSCAFVLPGGTAHAAATSPQPLDIFIQVALMQASDGVTQASTEDILLDVALIYAQKSPELAKILGSLGIQKGSDLKSFLGKEKKGDFARGIIAKLAFEYTAKQPKWSAWLKTLGVSDEKSLYAFIKGKNFKANRDTIVAMALLQARNNAKYAKWLDALGLKDTGDIKDLLEKGIGNNFRDLLINLGVQYVANQNTELSKYIVIFGLLFGKNIGGLNIGALQGLASPELQAVKLLAK